MDAATLFVAGTLLGLALALPGAMLSTLLLKDRWNRTHKGSDSQR